jgi:hypothetical protein
MNFQKGGSSVGQVVADADNDTLTVIGGPGVNFTVDENADSVILSLQSAEDIVASAIGRVEIRADDSTVRIVQGGENFGILGDGGVVSTGSNAEGDITVNVDTDLSNYDNSTSAFISNITAENFTDLSDVNLTSVADNDLLQYDTASGEWQNKSISAAGFATVSTTGTYSDLSGRPNLTFDGDISGNSGGALSGNAQTITLTLDNVNTDIGTFNTVTVNAKGLITSASNVNFATVATSGDYADLINKPSLAGTYQFNIAADDSTLEVINSQETIQLVGANSISTTLSDGVITVTGPANVSDLTNDSGFITASSTDTLTNKSGNISQWTNNVGYVTLAEIPNNFTLNVGADDSTMRDINAGEGFKILGAQNITTSSDAEGNITVTGPDLSTYGQTLSLAGNTGTGSVGLTSETMTILGTTGQVAVDVGGFAVSISLENLINTDLKGSVFADDSTLLVDGVSGTIPYGVLSGAPTNVSAFTNDSNYVASGANITEFTNNAGYVTASEIGATYNFRIGADDSTMRTVNAGEDVKILGGTAITTASDAEGNITITGVAQDFSWSSITGTPTTLTGYGITDAYTQAQVDAKVAAVLDSAPEQLNTLNELAAALNDDANFATTITNRFTNIENNMFAIGADDSTMRVVKQSENIKILGGSNITTSSDAEGNITVDFANPGYITAGLESGDNVSELVNDAGYITLSDVRFNVAADDSTVRQVNASETITFQGTGSTTVASDAEGNITIDSGNETITLFGDVTGSGTTSINVTLASSPVAPGTYNSVTVDTKGIVQSGQLIDYLVDGNNVSRLTNDAGYLTDESAVNFNIVGDDSTGFNMAAQGTFQFIGTNGITVTAAQNDTMPTVTIDGNAFVQTGDNVSTLVNDAGYYKQGSAMIGDLSGSVFSTDSGLVIDGQTGTLYGTLRGVVIGDVKGSVVADDSTVIIDGVAGKVATTALDTYAEGLHDYTITGSASGSLTTTTGFQKMSYTKIGNRCFISGKLQTANSQTLPTGDIRVSLPFACADLTDQGGQTAFPIMLYNVSGFTGGVTVHAQINEGDSFFTIVTVDANGIDSTQTFSDISDSGMEILINGHYPV